MSVCLESNEEDDGDGWDMDIEVPWLLVSVIFAMWVLYAVLYALLKMFSVCSLSYGVLLLFLYPLLLCEAAAGLAHVLRQQRREETARIAGIAQERCVRYPTLTYTALRYPTLPDITV